MHSVLHLFVSDLSDVFLCHLLVHDAGFATSFTDKHFLLKMSSVHISKESIEGYITERVEI